MRVISWKPRDPTLVLAISYSGDFILQKVCSFHIILVFVQIGIMSDYAVWHPQMLQNNQKRLKDLNHASGGPWQDDSGTWQQHMG